MISYLERRIHIESGKTKIHWYECNGDEERTCHPIKQTNDGSVLNVTIFMTQKKGILKPESAVIRVLKTFLIPGAALSVKSSRSKKGYLKK
jgi:hypothetical protein